MPAYSQATIQRFFQTAGAATTAAEKGKALEDLACYLFEMIPGLALSHRNAMNAYDTEEIDVAFWNEQYADGLKSLNALILVECKNWSKPIGSMEVSWFLTKIRNRGLDFGILVAASGITGTAGDRDAAHDVVSKALADGIRLILITRQEIEQLATSEDLVVLVKRKILSARRDGYGLAVEPAALSRQKTRGGWPRWADRHIGVSNFAGGVVKGGGGQRRAEAHPAMNACTAGPPKAEASATCLYFAPIRVRW